MRAYQNVDGGFTFGVHEYDIAKTTAIKAGQVVKLAEGLVVAATAAETGAILGVAKENHSGAEDAINPRSNGTKILVYDDPGMIMRCKAPVMAATSGSATTFVSTGLATLADDDLNGGYIVLVEKARAAPTPTSSAVCAASPTLRRRARRSRPRAVAPSARATST